MAGSLEDRNAIRELSTDYAAAASRKDKQAIAGMFTEDARVTGVAQAVEGGGDLIGPGAIGEFFGRMFDQIESVTQMAQPANIRVSGDAATSSCDIVEYVKYGGVPGFVIVVGHYDDELRRTASGWRFFKRALSFKIFSKVPEAS